MTQPLSLEKNGPYAYGESLQSYISKMIVIAEVAC